MIAGLTYLQLAIRVFLAGLLIASVALVGIWIGDREIPYEPKRGTISPQTPEPAGWITVTFEGKRNRNCDGHVYRQLVEKVAGKVHSYDPVPSIARDQKDNPNQEIIREVKLPAEVKPAEGENSLVIRYRVVTCYYCNPLQKIVWPICVRSPELEFTIMNSSSLWRQ